MEMNVEKVRVMRIWRQRSQVHFIIDQKQLKNVKHFNYLGTKITNYARCTS